MRSTNDETGQSETPTARRQRRLARFTPIFREPVAALTCCAPAAEDVAESFPGLLVALVCDFGSPHSRSRAFETVLNGGSVKDAATELGLPMWLKKMPPEAFREPLRQLPKEAQFTAKIGNFIPQKLTYTGDWLEQVSSADESCDSTFALWVAKHCGSVAASRRKAFFALAAAWAWHDNQPETIGNGLIETPWSPKMGLRRATEELMRWRRRVDLACLLNTGIETTWLEEGTVDGHDIVALRTLDDFISESRTMKNCLDQYADRLSTGLIRIFSVRQNGNRLADVEVGPISAKGLLPSIVQIKGPQNRQASHAVWQVVQLWLEQQPLRALPRRPGPVRNLTATECEPFWRPYLDWLPDERRIDFERTFIRGQRRASRRHLPHPVLQQQERHGRMRDTHT